MSEITQIGQRLAVSLDELDALLSNAKNVVQYRLQNFEVEPGIGKAEASAILGCSVSTLEKRLVKTNPPPHYKDSGKVTFYASELRAWRSRYRIGRIPNQASAT